MKTEYLIPIDAEKYYVKTESSFINLLKTNDEIEIKENKIVYKQNEFAYMLQCNPITNSNINCFHLTIENFLENREIELEKKEIIIYLELLKAIRKILSNYTDDFEILWDDISFCCSQIAYPKIYEIENLLRKLLTKFMLINIGTKWEKENIPSKIDRTKNKAKENIENSLLYKLDFIELSTFLFEPYSTKTTLSDLKTLIECRDEKIFTELDQYIPQSNWARYFSGIVSVDAEHIKKKWDELYKLRCKVAHNNLFGINELKRVIDIVTDLTPYINDAVKKLDEIEISEKDKETISENLAINTNGQIESFLIQYNKLYELIRSINNGLDEDSQAKKHQIMSQQELIKQLERKGVLDDKEGKRLQYVMFKRNQLVHSLVPFGKEEIKKSIEEVEECFRMLSDKEKAQYEVEGTNGGSMPEM